ncbi:hypothetical protein [Prescottella equi]|uniref:hypothetical protein n=1 Tax=Rhodococcus hoagii TaxID=43767 RepID=UPI000D0FB05E|nr:hypothetical protein [Prescottella equi]AVP71306.1 hypothetical protein C7H75_24805 [Prescottella equi]
MERIDYPPHMPRKGTLVGPVLRFRGQPVAVDRSAPQDTSDPRWNNCTDHHLACDCREAEQNEALNELRSEWRTLRAVLEAQLAGHPTEVYVDGDRRTDLDCKCQLCGFARAAHVVPFANQHDRWSRPRF